MNEIINKCSYEYIHSPDNPATKCFVLSKECNFTYFNLIQFNYCLLHDNKGVSIALVIIIMLFCFYFIASTSNRYLAPMLGQISERLSLSQNLAGLTILALGNQASDVLVIIISSNDITEGISMSLGVVLGSSLLILHIVLSTVILLGNKFEVVPSNYIRDFLVYLLSLIFVGIFGVLKQIVLWESICFLLLYFIYVIICIYMDKKTKEYLEKEFWSLKGDNDVSDDCEIKFFQDEVCVISQKDIKLNEVAQKSYFYKRNNLTSIAKPSLMLNTTLFSKFQVNDIKKNLNWSRIEWAKKTKYQKISYCLLEFPLNFIRDLTIPPFEKERWSKPMFIIMPFSIPLLLIGIFRLEQYLLTYYLYFIGFFGLMLIASIISFVRTNSHSPPLSWSLLIIGCIVSLCWLWGMSSILIDMVKVVQLLIPIEIPRTFFTITLVSVGNVLPDFFNNCALARTGYAEMAFSGSIGSPVFGMLFGFGIALIKAGINQTIIPFDIFDLSVFSNKILIAGLTCLVINLLRLLVEGFAFKFQIKRSSAIVGYSLYVAFVLVITYFSLL